jgi:hypothetical protein
MNYTAQALCSVQESLSQIINSLNQASLLQQCSHQIWAIDAFMLGSIAVSFSDDEFVIGPCRSTATHDNDRK